MSLNLQVGDRVSIMIDRGGSDGVLRLEGVISHVDGLEVTVKPAKPEGAAGEGEALLVALGY